MPLIACPDCGRQVSGAAPACPGCGRPMQAATLQVQSRTTNEIATLKVLGTLGCLGGFIVGAFGFIDASTSKLVWGGTLFLAGFVAFLIGRLQQ